MEEEFNWRLDEEMGSSPRRQKSQRPKNKEEWFGQNWFWHSHILLEKRATGQMLRLYLVLFEKDFDEWGKPFEVTTAMAKRAGMDRKAKAVILRAFEQWGLLWFESQGTSKNPRVALRRRKGRGENPFRNCR
jgi:hypothetical protein